MEQVITFAELDDFIFCPLSLFYHSMYKDRVKWNYQTTDQTAGTSAHKSVDEQKLTTRKNIIQSLTVYSEKYHLMGKIDTFDSSEHHLIERKRKIKTIYDGYIFQVYGQYFALIEMGYIVEKISFYSISDHKFYPVKLPHEDPDMFKKFERTLEQIRNFSFLDFKQENINKCNHCIYAPLCSQEESC